MPTSPTDPSDAIGRAAGGRRFRPRRWPTLAMLVFVPLFIAAGQWQWNKAEAKARQQAAQDAGIAQAAVAVPRELSAADTLRDRRVVARGVFEPQYQILIDNRTYRGQAGYHVVTPLRVDGSAMRILVNRGWVPAPADRATLPSIETPAGPVELSGLAVVPPARFFTLGAEAPAAQPGAWSPRWAHLDLARYAGAVDFPVQPVIVQLDPASTAGFVRDWPRPDDRRQTNLGYALQWWTFAATTVALWLVLNVRRPT